MSKTCTKCGETKDLAEFGRSHVSKYTGKDIMKPSCRACGRAAGKKRYYENHEESKKNAREKMAKHAHKHREERKAYHKNRLATNGDHVRKLDRERYAADPSRKKAAVDRYVKKFPEKKRTFQERRRARKANASGDCSIQQWQARLDYYGGKCIYCGTTERITQDHRIPLSRGGTHWPANLIPACHNCNCKKRTKTETEFKSLLATKEAN